MGLALDRVRVLLISAGFLFSQLALSQSPPGTVGEPGGAADVAPPEITPEAPSSASPFGAINPTGDPFGAISTSAIPSSLVPAAGGFLLGPVSIYPVLGFGLRYDDNLFLTNTLKRASWQTITSPGVRAEIRQPGGNVFGLTYKADIGRYDNSSNDNYEDHTLLGDANIIITTAARLAIRAEYLELHDPRGSTDRPSAIHPDEWHAPGISGIFSYGTPGARGRLDLSAGYQHKRYENNRAFTVTADRDTTFYGAAFYWRVTPITSALFEVRQSQIDYALATSTLDSKETRYYVGLTWEATAKTTGIFKVGHLKKDFDSAARTDFSGPSWEGRIRWSPLTYSVFEFTTSRETNETSGIGDFLVSRLGFVTWTHAWNSQVRSNMLLGYRTDDFEPNGVRKDKTASFGAGVRYQFRRWLTLGAQYIYTDRSSNTPINEYERNVIMFTLGATL